MQKQPSKGFFKESVMRNFPEFTRKHLCWNLLFDKVKFCRSSTSLKTSVQRKCFLVNFPKFLRTTFLQNRTGRLLLIIAVSIVVKRELENKNLNYDTKKSIRTNLSRKCKLLKKGSPGEIGTVFRSSRSQMFFKISVLENFTNSIGKHLCWRHF